MASFINRIQPYFIGIEKDTNEFRWFNLPDQLAKIIDGYPNFFFSAEISDQIVNPRQVEIVDVTSITPTTFRVHVTGKLIQAFTETPQWVVVFGTTKTTLTVFGLLFNPLTSQTEITFTGNSSGILAGMFLIPKLLVVRVKLPTPCDAVNILFDQARGQIRKQVLRRPTSDNGTNTILLQSFKYVPHTKNIKVFLNGKLVDRILYAEISPSAVNVFVTPITDLEIVSVDRDNNSFDVVGDVSDRFLNGLTFIVTGSAPLNIINGTYTVVSSSFNSTTERTTIFVTTDILVIPTTNGVINDLEAVFVVVLTPGILRSSEEVPDAEYRQVTNSIVEFLIDYSDLGQVTIQMLNPAVRAHTPLKLVDFRSQVVKATIPAWDPARGHHYEHSLQMIDIQDTRNPAIYEVTLDGVFNEREDSVATDPSNILLRWTSREVGTVWWDIRNLSYIPYFDKIIFPDLQQRNAKWGLQADWSSIRLYEWIQSSVPPDEWDKLVTDQGTNTLVASNDRPTGTPRKVLYKRTRSGPTQGFQELDLTFLTTLVGNVRGNSNTALVSSTATLRRFAGSVRGNSFAAVAIRDLNFPATALTLLTNTGLTVPTSYTFDIKIDDGGVVSTIVISTGNVPPVTFSDLLILLNGNLVGATATLVGGNIRITSNTFGETSSIAITKSQTYLFAKIQGATRFSTFGNQNFGTNTTTGFQDVVFTNNFTTATNTGLPNNETFTFNIQINDQPPEQFIKILTPGTGVVTFGIIEQLIENTLTGAHILTNADDILISPNVWRFVSNTIGFSSTVALRASPLFLFDELNATIVLTQNGLIVGPWSPFAKEIDSLVILHDVALLPPLTVELDASQLSSAPGDPVNVYINGVFKQTETISPTQTITLLTLPNQTDTVGIQHLAHVPTDDELKFDPDLVDDLETLVHYKFHTSYTTITTINEDEITTTTTYYFWLQDKLTKIDDHVHSLKNAATFLKKTPSPFFYMFHFLAQFETTNSDDQFVFVPDRFSKMILQGLGGIVNDTNRYKVRIPRDLTLRDRLRDVPIDEFGTLKNVHTEWRLFREKQTGNIPRELWDKITEAVLGHALDDQSVLLPTTDRILYDGLFDTDTRFGVNEGQSFTDGIKALTTIESILKSPDLDLDPLDKDTFFNTIFDTQSDAGIITMMDFIYNTFTAVNVNRIFFSVLLDSLSTKRELQNIFKTSWVSLQSKAELNVNGKFDNG